MRNPISLKFILIFGLLLTQFSCGKSKLFESTAAIPSAGWSIENRPVFEVDINDTLKPYNFYLLLRNTTHYPYSNIFVFMESEFPNGAFRKDTIECMLADQQGKWLGSGLGDIIDNKILFKRNVIFPKAGRYTFTFQHAMRVSEVSDITDVGLTIEAGQ